MSQIIFDRCCIYLTLREISWSDPKNTIVLAIEFALLICDPYRLRINDKAISEIKFVRI